MKTLVVHFDSVDRKRETIKEHLYSFDKYAKGSCYYLNAFYGCPSIIKSLQFDLIVFHYTFLSLKWHSGNFFEKIQNRCAPLKDINAYRIAIPQDEYVNTDQLNHFFKDFSINTVFTCLPSSEWQNVYPTGKSGVSDFVTVLTGYIEEEKVEEFKGKTKPHSLRDIDVGYRARKLPFWIGKQGLVKWRITNVFKSALENTNLRYDLSNDENKVFLGKNWLKFLCNCRIVLGCEGGASILDPLGEIRKKVDNYCTQFPEASFDEVKSTCFAGLDGNLNLKAISPRHFEAAITKTCQVLVEGEYAGIFKPWVHYIPIKEDFSNMDQVLECIRDSEYCEKMAERSYSDIVMSGAYTYKSFVEMIYRHCSFVNTSSTEKVKSEFFYTFYFNYYLIFSGLIALSMAHTKLFIYRIANHLGLLVYYRRLKKYIKTRTASCVE